LAEACQLIAITSNGNGSLAVGLTLREFRARYFAVEKVSRGLTVFASALEALDDQPRGSGHSDDQRPIMLAEQV